MAGQGTQDAEVVEIRDILRRLETAFVRADERQRAIEERLVALDARLSGVEARLDARLGGVEARLDKRIDALDARFRAVESDVAELKGRVSQLPTTLVLITAITTSQATLLGFTFAMLRYFGH